MKLLVHGDSNVVANYVPGGNWPQAVATALGFSSLVNMAVPGYHAVGVKNDLSAMIAQAPNLVIVMVGTNDMAAAVENDTPHATVLASYLETMTAIVAGLQAASIPVVLLSPVFSWRGREAIRYPDWIAGLASIAHTKKVPFVDVWTSMRRLSETVTEAAMVAFYQAHPPDDYHLSAAGHTLVAGLVTRAGKWLSEVPPPDEGAFTFLGAADTGDDLTTYTFPIPLGTPSATRRIVVAIGCRANASRSISSVTIAGITASLVGKADITGGSSTDIAALYRAEVPTGSSGNVVITFSGDMLRCAIAAYAVEDGAQNVVETSIKTTGQSPASVVIDVDGGVLVAGWFSSSGGAAVPSGFTMDCELHPDTLSNTFVAGRLWMGTTAADTPLALGSSTNFEGRGLLAVVSWD